MNWRAILGLGKDCTLAQAKAAYRKLAARYHPDKGTQGNAEKMVQINLAWAKAQEEFGTPKAKAKAKSTSRPEQDAPFGKKRGANFRKAPKNEYKPPSFDPTKPICGVCVGHGKVRIAVKFSTTDIACPRCHGWGNDPLGW